MCAHGKAGTRPSHCHGLWLDSSSNHYVAWSNLVWTMVGRGISMRSLGSAGFVSYVGREV